MASGCPVRCLTILRLTGLPIQSAASRAESKYEHNPAEPSTLGTKHLATNRLCVGDVHCGATSTVDFVRLT